MITILPFRLSLEFPSAHHSSISMFRGRWGEVLRGLDFGVYSAVFHPHEVGNGGSAPLYLLREGGRVDETTCDIECILFGSAGRQLSTILRAFDIAGGMGLGEPNVPFFVRNISGIGPDGAVLDSPTSWSISQAAWPLWGDPHALPCRLLFPKPLRIVRLNHQTRQDQLVKQPTFEILVDAMLRRIESFLGPECKSPAAMAERERLMQLAAQTHAVSLGWQEAELEVLSPSLRRKPNRRGVVGGVLLPEGAGELWPLVAQSQWLHLGKSTVLGMGQMLVNRVES